MRKKLPKWIVQHSGVHSVKGKKKILTSFQNGKIEWTDIDPKFKSYFMADRSKEKGYWADENSWLDEKNIKHIHVPISDVKTEYLKSTLTTANENVKDIINKQKDIKEAESSMREITKDSGILMPKEGVQQTRKKLTKSNIKEYKDGLKLFDMLKIVMIIQKKKNGYYITNGLIFIRSI